MRRITLVVVAVILAGCSGGASVHTPRPTVASTPVAAWWPSDFTPAPSDRTVAYRWLKAGEFTCRYQTGSACWGMYVIARDGCPGSLYVELSLTDGSGTVVGMANDTAGAVQRGQKAKLVFDTFEEAAMKARLADVSCY